MCVRPSRALLTRHAERHRTHSDGLRDITEKITSCLTVSKSFSPEKFSLALQTEHTDRPSKSDTVMLVLHKTVLVLKTASTAFVTQKKPHTKNNVSNAVFFPVLMYFLLKQEVETGHIKRLVLFLLNSI